MHRHPTPPARSTRIAAGSGRTTEPRVAAIVALVAAAVAAASSVAAEGLPRSRPWQGTLRDHLASLAEVEFEVEVEPVRRDTEPLDDDGAYRDWLLLGSALDRLPGDDEQPDITILRRRAADYLLTTIEADGGVWMSVKRHSPVGAAWWAGWSYPGNPYHNSRAVVLRGYVPAAVDLIMMAEEEGAERDDTLALHLLGDAYAYLQAMEILPEEVRRAFESGIVEAFTRLEAAGPPADTPTCGLALATTCAIVARAVDQTDVAARAKSLARRTVEERIRPAGYAEFAGGYDPQAAGAAGYHLAFAALLAPDDWDFLRAALARTSDLRGHLLLPEPSGGTCHGPTQFAPAGAADGFQDDEGHRSREVAAAMLTGPGICLLFNDRPRRGGSALPGRRVRMDVQIGEAFSPVAGRRSVNAALATQQPAPEPRAPWTAAESPLDHLPFDHDYYHPGTLERFRRATPLPIARLPVAREADFARDFDEEILVTRFGGAAAIVHTGRIAPGEEPRGFSGGALAAFWTPATGPVLLGRRQPLPVEGVPADSWLEWWRWQAHALAGTGAEGRPFSTARLPRAAFTELVRDVGRDRASVSVTAPLHERGTGANDAVTAGALEGDVTYSRRFDIDGGGVRIETSIKGDGSDTVGRLVEILPVFNDARVENAGVPATEASVYLDDGSGWRPAPPRPVAAIRRVRIDRHGGAVVIEFERPQRVGLALQSGGSCHNLLVELLEREGVAEPLESFGVTYTISPIVSRR